MTVPPPYHDPYARQAAVPPQRRKRSVAVGVLTALVVTLLTVDVATLAVRTLMDGVEEQRRQEAVADAAVDDAIARPADSESIKAAPDGTKRWVSEGPFPASRTYRIALPRGWAASRVAARANEDIWNDSVLTRPGSGTIVLVDRVDLGGPLESPEVESALRRALTEDRIKVVSPYTPTKVGDGIDAFYFDVEGTSEDGNLVNMRVIVFQYGGEQFRLDFATMRDEWPARLKEFQRILASWRWGA